MNPKERKFTIEYLKDQNATQSAIRAGYSKRSAGQIGGRLMKKDEIRAKIDALLGQATEKALVSREFIVTGLRQNAIRSQQGEPVMEFDHEEKRMVATGTWEYDSAGSNRAFELLGKTLGMFTDNLRLDVSDDLGEALKTARKRKANAK